MLLIPKLPSRYRTSKPLPLTPPVPAGPALIEADFDIKDGLTLSFDPNVVITAFEPSAITLNDPDSGSTYVATGAAVLSGFIVVVSVTATGPSSGATTTLTANANSGIVSADTGGMWAGVTDYPVDTGDAAAAA